jgi:hypothetical protein
VASFTVNDWVQGVIAQNFVESPICSINSGSRPSTATHLLSLSSLATYGRSLPIMVTRRVS